MHWNLLRDVFDSCCVVSVVSMLVLQCLGCALGLSALGDVCFANDVALIGVF